MTEILSLLPSSTPRVPTLEALVALMLAATVVGIAAQRAKIPYTVALVLVGIGLRTLGWIPALHLTQELLVTIFLPALLFEAAIHVPGSDFRKMLPSFATFAVPGVVIAAVAMALLLKAELIAFNVETTIPFLDLLLFGTIIAATDPISVIALFKQLGVDKRLAIMVEGESLLNDGTAIIFFGIVLQQIRGTEVGVGAVIAEFFLVVGGGALIGAAIGLLASWLIGLIDDHLLEIALTSVAAYGSFLLAETAHVSGFLSVVVTGLIVGNIGKKKGMTPQSRLAVLSFWEYAAFFINSILFLLLGLEVKPELIFDNVGIVVLAFIAVVGSRAATVYAPIPFLRRIGQPIDNKSATVLWWGGLRGGLSMVLVLSLPDELVWRDLLIAMTFGVVLLSVVVQGSTMSLLLNWLGLVPKRSEAARFLSVRLARLRAIDDQQHAVDQMIHESARELPGLDTIKRELAEQREAIVRELSERAQDPAFVEAATARASAIRRHLTEVARDAYRDAQEHSLIDDEDAAMLTAELERQT